MMFLVVFLMMGKDYLFLKKKMEIPVSYTHLRAHETSLHLVCRLLLEKTRLGVARLFATRLELRRCGTRSEHAFFQAEDGIRDVERSRGLGDVYRDRI